MTGRCSQKIERKFYFNNKCGILAQNNSTNKPTTCHSCKHKCNDVYSLLQHVFVAHGLRVSEEDLPNFAFNENQNKSDVQQSHRNQPVLTSTPTSNFGLKNRLACKSLGKII